MEGAFRSAQSQKRYNLWHQDSERFPCLEGTLQRVDYRRKELAVVAEGRVWRFALAADCQLWFDDQPAILRCFHPLDRVKILYVEDAFRPVVKAIYAWDRQAAA